MQVHYTELLRQATLDQTMVSSKINEDDSFSDSLSGSSSSSSSSSSLYCSDKEVKREFEEDNVEDERSAQPINDSQITTIDEASETNNSDIQTISKDQEKGEKAENEENQQSKTSALERVQNTRHPTTKNISLRQNSLKEEKKENQQSKTSEQVQNSTLNSSHQKDEMTYPTESATSRYDKFLASMMQDDPDEPETTMDDKSMVNHNNIDPIGNSTPDLNESSTTATTKISDGLAHTSLQYSKDQEDTGTVSNITRNKSIFEFSTVPPTVAESFTIDMSAVKAFDIRDKKVCRISISSRQKIFQMRRHTTDQKQQQPRSLSFHESRPHGQMASIGTRSQSDENFITIGSDSTPDGNLSENVKGDGNPESPRRDEKTCSDSKISESSSPSTTIDTDNTAKSISNTSLKEDTNKSSTTTNNELLTILKSRRRESSDAHSIKEEEAEEEDLGKDKIDGVSLHQEKSGEIDDSLTGPTKVNSDNKQNTLLSPNTDSLHDKNKGDVTMKTDGQSTMDDENISRLPMHPLTTTDGDQEELDEDVSRIPSADEETVSLLPDIVPPEEGKKSKKKQQQMKKQIDSMCTY